MKRFGLIALSLVLCGTWAFGREAPWEDQLKEMNYLLLTISAVNAINALNLSADQAAELGRLVRQIEHAGASAPHPRGPFHPGLQETLSAYRELKQLLLQRKDLPESLEKRIGEARMKEAEVIKNSIRGDVRAGGSCASCHPRPRPGAASSQSLAPEARGYSEHEVFTAHLVGVYGTQGVRELVRLVPQVDALLTDAQKDIMQNFACCLIPPTELSDPVRAGQVEASDKAVAALRSCRTCPDRYWPTAKERFVEVVVNGRKARQPGVTQSDLDSYRLGMTKMLENVRAMPDTEFEMKKADLCAQFKPDSVDLNLKQRQFMAAYFLLLPGCSEVYVQAIKHAPE